MSDGMAGALGEAIATEMAAMNNSSAAFQSELDATRNKQKEMMEAVFKGFQTKNKGPEFSAEAARIAKIVDSNPLLMKAVSRFVEAKRAEVSAAVSSVLGVTPDDMTPK